MKLSTANRGEGTIIDIVYVGSSFRSSKNKRFYHHSNDRIIIEVSINSFDLPFDTISLLTYENKKKQ